jgi:nitroreductase
VKERTVSSDFDLATTDRLLSTTRAVRRRLDLGRPVEPQVIHDCIALSQQSPTASNTQQWRWLVVDDASLRAQLAEIYARALPAIESQRNATPESDRQTRRVYDSAAWLMDHLAEVPIHAIPCVVGRPPEQFVPISCSSIYGSIVQAVWSFQLALRSRGLGSTFTTVHLLYEQEVAELLGIPDDVLQIALLPVAYTLGGDFKPATRPTPESITSWNHWDSKES